MEIYICGVQRYIPLKWSRATFFMCKYVDRDFDHLSKTAVNPAVTGEKRVTFDCIAQVTPKGLLFYRVLTMMLNFPLWFNNYKLLGICQILKFLLLENFKLCSHLITSNFSLCSHLMIKIEKYISIQLLLLLLLLLFFIMTLLKKIL